MTQSPLPMLVLLPGLDGTGILFAELVKALGPAVDCGVVAYPKDTPLGYDELEALVTASFPPTRPFVLLGESFSGPLALRLAARHPDGLVGLILCATFARNPYPLLRWARQLAAYLPLKSFPRWLRAPLMWGSTSPNRASAQSERAIAGVSAAVIRHRIRELMSVDQAKTMEQIRMPTLVLRASRDRVISKRATLELARGIPGARLAEIDGPHLLLKTRPEACAKTILKFLASLAMI